MVRARIVKILDKICDTIPKIFLDISQKKLDPMGIQWCRNRGGREIGVNCIGEDWVQGDNLASGKPIAANLGDGGKCVCCLPSKLTVRGLKYMLYITEYYLPVKLGIWQRTNNLGARAV